VNGSKIFPIRPLTVMGLANKRQPRDELMSDMNWAVAA
jgi:hypothetical protein